MSEELDARAFCERVLERAKSAGASYADVRIVRREYEGIDLRTGKVEGLERRSNRGLGMRVIADSSWGFAASPNLIKGDANLNFEEGERVAAVGLQAIGLARTSAGAIYNDLLTAKARHTR